ncbi:thiol:disulfide interchange protein DsbG [Vibrio sp. PP-XX7]
MVQEFNVSGGLRAFAGVADGRPIAVYVTHDDKAIVGTRLDANGSPIDEKTLQNLVVKPMSKKIWAQLSSATWVRDGKADAPRIIYAFSDANCPYCHRFWEVSRPWVNAGKVQVRYIFVGVIREDSPAEAWPLSLVHPIHQLRC